jgi:hypothetical protein
MGFARRVARKSVRKVTPRPVRQAMHPARTVKNAVTPRPVKQVSRTAYTVRHPVGAADNKLIDVALNAGSGRRRSRWRNRLSFLPWSRRDRQPEPPDASRRPRAAESAPANTAAGTLSRPDVLRLLRQGARAEAIGCDLVLLRDGMECARKTFSSAEDAAAMAERVNGMSGRRPRRTTKPAAGARPSGPVESGTSAWAEAELEARRHIGLGGDWWSPGQSERDRPAK